MTYELLTGRPPFTGRQEQIMYQHFNVSPQPPGTFNPTLPKDIDTVLLKALEKKPADRFLSIAAFANALQQASQSGDIPRIVTTLNISPSAARHLERTVPASDPNPLAETITPSRSNSSNDMINRANSHIYAPSAPTQVRRRSPASKSKTIPIALIILALLVVSTSVGAIYFQGLRHSTGNSPDIAATTHANDATSFAATATGQSSNTNATTQAINATATHQTGNTGITATALSTPIFPPPNATLALNDPLSANDHGYGWETQPDTDGVCQFVGGVYQVSETRNDTREYCPAYNTSFGSNFAYEVQMKPYSTENSVMIW